MNKVQQLLLLIQNKVEELISYDDPEVNQLTPSELILLATNMVLQGSIEIKYSQPIGYVDTTKVTFVLDDNYEVLIGVDDED